MLEETVIRDVAERGGTCEVAIRTATKVANWLLVWHGTLSGKNAVFQGACGSDLMSLCTVLALNFYYHLDGQYLSFCLMTYGASIQNR
jgi:hypothetical protein